jgi:hypothetical protein
MQINTPNAAVSAVARKNRNIENSFPGAIALTGAAGKLEQFSSKRRAVLKGHSF